MCYDYYIISKELVNVKIVALDAYPVLKKDLEYNFEKYGECIVYDRTAEEDVIERLQGAEVVITNKVPIDRKVMENTKLKYISVSATGYNMVDLECAKEKGILVSNVKNYSTAFVAQHAIALILEVMNQVGLHNATIDEWLDSKDFSYSLSNLEELGTKTVGVVGYGNIAKRVIKILQAFGANILVYNRTKYLADETKTLKFVDLDTLLHNSDIITLHVPLTKANKYLINEVNINKMKDKVIICNTSRGALVDEKAMLAALKTRKVAYYLADVLEAEPAKNKELLDSEYTVITPHIAWSSYEARVRLINGIEKNLADYVAGHLESLV